MESLFNMGLNTGLENLGSNNDSNDGLYRPKLEKAKDKKKGYKAKLRFLPNFTQDNKLEESAIMKILHYVKLDAYPDLSGYYDSQKVFGKEVSCPLYDTYWALKNSKNELDKEKADSMISRSKKYYSYVYVLEDENQPELEGKIMIYAYGMTIAKMIDEEKTGVVNDPCNVFDLAKGKDFTLLITEKGGYANYESSRFKEDPSPIRIKGKEIPTEEVNGVITVKQELQPKIVEFLKKRDCEIDSYKPKKWSEEQRNKVDRVISIVKNDPIARANRNIESDNIGLDLDESVSESASSNNTSSASAQTVDSIDDGFFDDI